MTRIVTYESYTPVYIRVQWTLSADILLLFYLPQRGTFFNAVMPYVLYLIITSAFSLDFYICFIFQYNECLIMFFTPYNFTSIFLTIKGPVSQETVLVLFHRRYPTVPILLSSTGVYTKFSGRLSEEPFPWLIQKFPCILIFKTGQPGCQLNLSEGQIRLDLTSGRPLV